MKFDKKYIQTRFTIIVICALVVCILIAWRAIYTATIEREKWQKMGEMSVSEQRPIDPVRGKILSSDGQLMASSLPDYKVFIDFLSGIPYLNETTPDTVRRITIRKRDYSARLVEQKDSTWRANIDSISKGLAAICDRYTAEEYKAHLLRGLEGNKRYWDLTPRVVLNFIQYNKLIKLPILCETNRNKSGLIPVERNNRNKPFGSLAKRTLGEMYGAKDSARSGLELAYDSLLRGEPGLKHNKKVLNKFLSFIDKEAVDGYDIVTTIDVSMQDICESALREELEMLEAYMGVVILMEVKTGDVKAIVNLERYDDGNYYEARNFALAALMEPGSTFKTASMMVAIDDGYVKTSDVVDTGNGLWPIYGAVMRDHNWATKGGYGVIDVPHILMVSSNIGVSKLIDKYYHHQPEKFVEGLHRVGIGTPLGLPFQGAADPRIRYPHKDRFGGYTQSDNWSKTALPWMSIGYETQIPPISTVTFYNAIANGGKMVRPRFVKAYKKGDEIVQELPVEVIKKSICKPSTLADIQGILQRVVCDKEGLGKKAGNPYFHVSGKTGTAQVAYKRGSGAREHLVSFCGYYPSENPRYTCLVAIRHSYYVASGGGQAGPVFSKIAQRVYSKNVTTDLRLAQDSTSVFVPDVKPGDEAMTNSVLKTLNVSQANRSESPATYSKQLVPDVTGLGLRDAVSVLSQHGLKVRAKGSGTVKKQSLTAGKHVGRGETIIIELG